MKLSGNSLKRKCKGPINIWKDAELYLESGKGKLKSSDTISHPSCWQKIKRKITVHTGYKERATCTAGGSVAC